MSNSLKESVAQNVMREVNQRFERDQRTHNAEEGMAQLGILATANTAREFHKRLAERIRAFESSLDRTQRVGVELVSYGRAVRIAVTNVGYQNPSLIILDGESESGSPVELIQHVTQLSFLLTAVERAEPDSPRPPIGYAMTAETTPRSGG
jgi:Fe-S cluster assembly ATPase SufC